MFNRVCVAGTFDGLHKGHQTLLTAAFAKGKHVIIALTSDTFVRLYKGKDIASFDIRKAALLGWLGKQQFVERAEVISIDDAIGPAATTDLDALIVTSQNRNMGEKINALRLAKHKSPVELIEVPLVSAEDHRLISSTRIRRGEIDSHGRLVMPDNMRDELSQPLGLILTTPEMITSSFVKHKDAVVISVGDMTTKTIVDAGLVPRLAIIDNKVNRKSFQGLTSWLTSNAAIRIKLMSGPGYISTSVVEHIQTWASDPQRQRILEIHGEEDLLALPVLVEAPIGSVMYYGQPNVPMWACGPLAEGIVEVVVTDENKKIAQSLLSKFIH